MEETGGEVVTAKGSLLKEIRLHTLALVAFFATVAAAVGGSAPPPCFCNQLGMSAPVWRLHLVAKSAAGWQVIEGGAWGELTIRRSSGGFQLKAAGLRPRTEYALVRYAGKGHFGEVLLRGLSDSAGAFSGAGIWQQWHGKFWVVLGDDLQGGVADFRPGGEDRLKAWHPADYLFESEELL